MGLIITASNLKLGVEYFRNNWKSSGGKRDFLDNFRKNIDLYGVYKASAISAVGASNQRALKLDGNKNLLTAKEECYDIIANSLEALFGSKNKSLSFFDEWEKNLADKIKSIHKDKYGIIDYTYGNAQKWINLSIKYLFWYSGDSKSSLLYTDEVFKICYFPIDGIIQNTLYKESHKKVPRLGSWSACDDWNKIVDYEKNARNYTNAEGWYSPLVWEVSHW